MSIRVHLNLLCQELPSGISGGGIVIIVLVTGGTAQGLIDHGPHGYVSDSFQFISGGFRHLKTTREMDQNQETTTQWR